MPCPLPNPIHHHALLTLQRGILIYALQLQRRGRLVVQEPKLVALGP